MLQKKNIYIKKKQTIHIFSSCIQENMKTAQSAYYVVFFAGSIVYSLLSRVTQSSFATQYEEL